MAELTASELAGFGPDNNTVKNSENRVGIGTKIKDTFRRVFSVGAHKSSVLSGELKQKNKEDDKPKITRTAPNFSTEHAAIVKEIRTRGGRNFQTPGNVDNIITRTLPNAEIHSSGFDENAELKLAQPEEADYNADALKSPITAFGSESQPTSQTLPTTETTAPNQLVEQKAA